MANTSAWIGGLLNGSYTLAWTSAGFTAASFNSLASGSCVVGSTIDNSTALDPYMELWFSFIVGGTTTSASQAAAFLLPLGGDGVTYGDGAVTGGTTIPSMQYCVGTFNVQPGILSGSAITGVIPLTRALPPGKFRLAVQNLFGVNLNAAASASILQRTFRENFNA